MLLTITYISNSQVYIYILVLSSELRCFIPKGLVNTSLRIANWYLKLSVPKFENAYSASHHLHLHYHFPSHCNF
jgi:hypothetical protein